MNQNPQIMCYKCHAPKLQYMREKYKIAILDTMPTVMILEVASPNDDDKTRIILTCLGGGYIRDWLHIYSHIAMFVFNINVSKCDCLIIF